MLLCIYSVLIVVLVPTYVSSLICSRYPANTLTPKSPVDENFVLSINGNPQTYILGQEYNISLNAYNGLRFLSFSLVLENDEGDTTYHEDLGSFEIIDHVETRYSPKCINMVDSTNTNPKTRIDVTWIAPSQPGSGCILIRATILQHRDVWHMDDGGLTKRICEEVVDDVESRNIEQFDRPCCACDEARYELTFEGVWSRNLHPKDFPAKGWTTRFSDIIGAAHTKDFRFWEYGALATAGMKEFAEHGSLRLIEREFNMNFRNGKIRTIIKARGPAFPNLNGQSVAYVRVDPKHHLVSLASKIEPSPDWIVGVSGLELCQTNCTWLEQKVINLYPWDAGTDGGPSYTSPNQPQIPPDVIRRIRSDYPNDPRSPFFDETGAPMKPLATLSVKRQRLYERACENPESNNVDTPRECFTHPWSAWTKCTAKCGEGRQYRSRVYKQPEVAKIYNCDIMTVKRQDRICSGNLCGDSVEPFRRQPENFLNDDVEFIDGEQYGGSMSNAECQLTPWSAWSGCNVTCGEGKIMRRREYANSYAEQKCQSARFVPLYEYKNCMGRNCLGEIRNQPTYNMPVAPNENYYQNRANGGNENFYQNQAEVVAEYEEQPQYNSNSWGNPVSRPYEPNSYNENMDNNELDVRQDGYSYNNELTVENLNVGNERKDSRNNRYALPQTQSEQQRSLYQQYRQPGNIHDNQVNSAEPKIISYCFEPLQMFTCLDSRVVGNYWFYNYCEDACMLYAADSCDRNENKFNSLEMCEMRCRQREFQSYLRTKQQTECPKKFNSREFHDRGGSNRWRA